MNIQDLNFGITLQNNLEFLRKYRDIVAQSNGFAFGSSNGSQHESSVGSHAASNLLSSFDQFAVHYHPKGQPAKGAPEMLCTKNVFECAKTLMLAELDRMIAQAETSFEMLGNNGASA